MGAGQGRVSATTEEIAADSHVLAAARRRIRRHESDDRGTGLVTGGSFLLVVGAWLALAAPVTVPVALFVACVLVFVVAASVEFEIGPGCALPTTPVQVVMLFLLPPVLVPVAVLLGLVLAALVAELRDRDRHEHFLVLCTSAWQVVGPAAVFALAGSPGPGLDAITVLAIALASQFAIDLVVTTFRIGFGLGVPVRSLTRALGVTFLCDLALAPVGFAAARAFPASAGAALVLVPPILLLAILQRDREQELDRRVTLALAYADTQDLARRDPLTGLANRLAFEEASTRIRSSAAPVGIVLADVDGLKAANDAQGHHVGDSLLVAIAELVGAAADSVGATAFRIGGDEFVVVLPAAGADASERLGSALRAAIRAAAPVHPAVPASASVGAGWSSTGIALGAALATADGEVAAEKSARGVARR